MIGGIAFRHKVSTTPKNRGIYDLNITIQSEIHNGSKLVIKGLIQKDVTIWPPGDFREHINYPTVTRHEVEWLVNKAIANGWSHSAKGPNFILEASNEIFRYGFLVEQLEKQRSEQGITGTANAIR
jgi:hypothetical protein